MKKSRATVRCTEAINSRENLRNVLGVDGEEEEGHEEEQGNCSLH